MPVLYEVGSGGSNGYEYPASDRISGSHNYYNEFYSSRPSLYIKLPATVSS